MKENNNYIEYRIGVTHHHAEYKGGLIYSHSALRQAPLAFAFTLMRVIIQPDWTPSFLTPSLGDSYVRHSFLNFS